MHDNKTWSGRFNEPVSELVKKYTGSIDFDKRLAKWDIDGSLAHAEMLKRVGVLSEQDLAAIQQGMAEIIEDIKSGSLEWSLDLEDVHMNIERRLTDKIGDAGKRLHTGRSRNDQVATDIRLWLRDEITVIQDLIKGLQASLLDLAEQNVDVVMPGFTHLQVAQPVSFGHHMLAYVEMLGRDFERMVDCRKRVNRMPLGAAALAGTTYPIDRSITAELLGFEQICQNSLDAVSDRDFAIEFTAAASLVMVHLSRLSEELILWMSPRVGFIDIADRFCTGSSIMPQKKNPDVCELVRGKTGRVVGHLMAMLTTLKGLPMTYNKDMQEDKEGLFDALDTWLDCLHMAALVLDGIQVKRPRCQEAAQQGYANATELADYLVAKGVPFREAHHIVGETVVEAIRQGKPLEDLSLADLQKFSAVIGDDVYPILSLQSCLDKRAAKGGVSPQQVAQAIDYAKARLA